MAGAAIVPGAAPVNSESERREIMIKPSFLVLIAIHIRQ
jgi:hypothetical protein